MPLSDQQERLERIGEQLRGKISSKFTSSSFLAGFALTVLSGQVFALWQSESLPALFPLAIGVLMAAVILFVDALLWLDSLTMPKALWPAPHTPPGSLHLYSSVLEPPDITNLYGRMVLVWAALAQVAMVATAVAVLLMLIPYGAEKSELLRPRSLWFALGGVVTGVGYSLVLRRIVRNKYAKLETGPD